MASAPAWRSSDEKTVGDHYLVEFLIDGDYQLNRDISCARVFSLHHGHRSPATQCKRLGEGFLKKKNPVKRRQMVCLKSKA